MAIKISGKSQEGKIVKRPRMLRRVEGYDRVPSSLSACTIRLCSYCTITWQRWTKIS
jgi:hypothetical protein